MHNLTIRIQILKVLRRLGGHAQPSEEQIDMLVAKVQAANPSKPLHFAHILARNWAFDQFRKADAAQRKQQLELFKSQQLAEEEALRIAVREELTEITLKLVDQLSPIQMQCLDLVYLRHIDGLSDAQCEAVFPSTSREQRYKWLQRGRKLLHPYSSPRLLKELARRLSSPPSV